MKLDKDLKKMLRNILKEMETESERKSKAYWSDTEALVELTRGDLCFIFDSLEQNYDKIADLENRINAQKFFTNLMPKNDIAKKEEIINQFFKKTRK